MKNYRVTVKYLGNRYYDPKEIEATSEKEALKIAIKGTEERQGIFDEDPKFEWVADNHSVKEISKIEQ